MERVVPGWEPRLGPTAEGCVSGHTWRWEAKEKGGGSLAGGVGGGQQVTPSGSQPQGQESWQEASPNGHAQRLLTPGGRVSLGPILILCCHQLRSRGT